MTYAHNHKQRNAVGMAIERGDTLDYAGEGQAGGLPASLLPAAREARPVLKPRSPDAGCVPDR